MFSEMIADLNRSIMPEPVNLTKRFDFALTKKLGVVELPPAFRMQDSKINPRSDHLLWAAMLLLDRNRIELALSVIAVEVSETSRTTDADYEDVVALRVADLTDQLLLQIPDTAQREKFESNLQKIMPDWPDDHQENAP